MLTFDNLKIESGTTYESGSDFEIICFPVSQLTVSVRGHLVAREDHERCERVFSCLSHFD